MAAALQIYDPARVFEAFATSDEAVRSFSAVPAEAVAQETPWVAGVFGELGALKQAS